MESTKACSAVLVLLGVLLSAACSGGSDTTLSPLDAGASCTEGTEACPCYPNKTCNAELSCFSNVCVNAGGDAGSNGPDAASGNDASSGDEASDTADVSASRDATIDGASDATTSDSFASDSPAPSDAPLGGDGSACTAGAPCVPPGAADPCGLYATDCSSGGPVCVRVGNQPAGQPCGGGSVCSAAASCINCVDGAPCVPSAAPCYQGTLACATATCMATTTATANGSACGTDAVCNGGVCTACASNEACTPSQGPCVQGRTDCSTGTSQCQAIGPLPDGTPCGANPQNVCSAGACTACVSGSPCVPTNPCHTGILACGAPTTCTDTGSRPDNVFCGVEELCAAGTCSSARPWITRGEDNRTFTGGWVYSFANNGATVTPTSSTTVAFVPSPGGRTGNALQISGIDPVPATDVSVLAALGWTFTDLRAPLNLAALGSGIDLWIKSAYSGPIQIFILDVWTDPSFPNCSMSTSPTVVDRCYNWAGATCNVTTVQTWTECSISWSSFVRPNWGNAGAGLEVDASQALAVQINVPPTSISSSSAVPFDFAVDDVSFLP